MALPSNQEQYAVLHQARATIYGLSGKVRGVAPVLGVVTETPERAYVETFSQNHKNLQVLCAEIWSSAADCELILSYLGIEASRINLAEPSIMRWLSIIRELMFMNDGSLSRLIIVLMNQYPNNTTLRAVCAPWMPVAPASVLTTHVESPVVVAQAPVPVMVAAEFAEEAALILPRLDALWETMIEVRLRITTIEAHLAAIAEWRSKSP